VQVQVQVQVQVPAQGQPPAWERRCHRRRSRPGWR
jgi:hypothetical protein